MSKISQSILDEYLSEVREKIEDDNTRLKLQQVFSGVGAIWKLIFIGLIYFLTANVVVGTAIIYSMDVETLNILKSASNESLISGLHRIETVVIFISILSFLSFITIFHHKYFRSKREERIQSDQDRVNLISTIVEINEELLLRHGLIKKEENQ